MSYGKVGVQTLSDGSAGPIRLDERGNMVTSGTGKYREATLAGRVFAAANQAVVTSTVGLATTYTGLALCNPAGSGKNFVVLEVGLVNEIAVPTNAAIFGIMTGGGIGAATAVIAGRNRLSGGPASVAYVDDAVIFTEAPVLEQVFHTFHTGAVTTAVGSGCYVVLDGSLVITPGYHASIYISSANAATWMGSFLWEEIAA
jgi:hypothetical protein